LETVSLKLKPETAKRISRALLEFDYGTKTEFIREAIRDKLNELEKQKAWEKLFAMRGILKGKSKFKTDEEWHEWRSNEGSKELLEYFENKFKAKQK